MWHGYIGNRRNFYNCGDLNNDDIDDHYINNNDHDDAADSNFRCFDRCGRSRNARSAT
jgi:hypothetical protein